VVISLPAEYRKFLEEEVLARKLSLYEKFCKFFSFIKLPIPKDLEKKYKEEIEFTHLSLTPAEIFSSSIIFPFLLILISIFLLPIFGIEFLLMVIVTSGIIAFFLITYPDYYKFLFRSKASSEMMLAVVYLVIAMRIYRSLDKAVAFAAKNLTGPLGRDFKEILWEVYSGKRYSILDALDEMSKKWHVESEEFSEALSLIKGSASAGSEKNLDEALNLMLSSTVVRMESYARKMKTPISLINMFGILLPLLGLVAFPILFLMLPEIGKPSIISFLYNVVLFLIIYLLLRQHLALRPYSFHQPELTKVGKIREWKRKSLIISLSVFLILFSFVSTTLFSKPILIADESQFILSLFLIFSIFFPVILYNFLLYRKARERNEAILQIEAELPTALEELSIFLRTGAPIESSIQESSKKMQNLKIRLFFEKILNNITRLGLPFSKAIFDEKLGAIREFPSRMLNAIMGVIVEIGERGSIFLSDAVLAISKYLNDARVVSEKTKGIMEEVTYDIRIQSLALAPITSGVIVGLTVFTLAIFFYFGGSIQSLKENLSSLGPAQDLTTGGIFSLVNFSRLISIPIFQLIVGIYLFEVTMLMCYFYAEINYGDDEISKCDVYWKTLLIVLIIYTALVLGLYYGIKSFINIQEMVKAIK
jgi:Flp pilus assembly protein TadB